MRIQQNKQKLKTVIMETLPLFPFVRFAPFSKEMKQLVSFPYRLSEQSDTFVNPGPRTPFLNFVCF